MSANILLACAIGLPISVTSVPPPGTSFTPIGFLPGEDESLIHGMTADGSVLVGSASLGDSNVAVRWDAVNGLQSIGALPGSGGTQAHGVSADGSVIVGLSNQRAFRWTQAGGITDLGSLRADNQGFANAWGVSADGNTILGTAQSDSGFDVFRWRSATGMANEGYFDGSALSADGKAFICTDVLPGGIFQALLVTDGQDPVELGDLPGGIEFNQPHGLSRDGRIVVGESSAWPVTGPSDGVMQGYVWKEQTGIVGLGSFNGATFPSCANGVSDDGSVIVGYGTTGAGDRAAIWLNGGPIQNLKSYLLNQGVTEVAAWSLTRATAVSADGTVIAGWGTNPQGQLESWVVHIPGPGSWGILTLGGIWAGGRRRPDYHRGPWGTVSNAASGRQKV